jgi:carboxyl-terminal processing protease
VAKPKQTGDAVGSMSVILYWLLCGLSLANTPMYERMATLVSANYLTVEDLNVADAFVMAAEEAEGDIPWLIVEAADEGVFLRHGLEDSGVTVEFHPSSDPGLAVLEMPAALSRLETAILGLGHELPEDLDLGVTLLRGMARALDKNSTVMARDRLARFNERIRGRLTGIGARIGQLDGELVIRGVFAGAPSDIGGLQTGDVILRIDGISTVGMSVSQSVERIRGEEDTEVVLQVRRQASDGAKILDISMTRAVVVIPNVSWELLDSGIGYITVDNFSEQTVRLLSLALEELSESGASGWIVDLRGNSGGSMSQSCKAADLFMEEGTVLTTVGKGGARVSHLMQEYVASSSGFEPNDPIVILMDSYSASASEILGGVLRDSGRAVLIGDRSYGKGTVQKLYTLRGGSEENLVRLKLTVAEYRVAGHLPIVSGEGLEPDLYVESAVFGREGVYLPSPRSLVSDAPPRVLWVDELPGWRGQPVNDSDSDPVIDVAERVITEALHDEARDVALALEAVTSALQSESDEQVVQTFAGKSVNWSAASSLLKDDPSVLLHIETSGEVRAGEEVELHATIENQGGTDLHRARVEIRTDPSSPWDGIVIPLGHIEAGGSAKGTRILGLDADEPGRIDALVPTLYVDGRDGIELDPVDVEIDELIWPHLVIRGRLTSEEGRDQVVFEVENHSEHTLEGLSLGLALKDDSTVEILERQAVSSLLTEGAKVELALGVRLPRSLETDVLELELRVNAERFGRILQTPIELPMTGEWTRLEQPRISGNLPHSVASGTHIMVVQAEDDEAIESVRVWLDGEKIGWYPGAGSQLHLEVPVSIEPGQHRIHLQVIDDDGARKTRLYRVRGEPVAP